MTLTKILTATLAASVMLGASAQADDGKKFDGLYGGLELGIDQTRLQGPNKESMYYGGILGYRSQMDSGLVLGLEGTLGDNKTNISEFARTKYEWSTSLLLGTPLSENTLLFGKLGYAKTKSEFDLGNGPFTESDGGWRAGGGLEFSLSDNLSLRAGVDYTRYDGELKQVQGKTAVLFKF